MVEGYRKHGVGGGGLNGELFTLHPGLHLNQGSLNVEMAQMANCTPCPLIFSGKCSDCPEHQAELAEYFGNIEKRIMSILSPAVEVST